jgi:solute carrier family 25 (mitochondrial citrate transporter), member 1
LGLYKGLGAVLTGIVPKMALRFTSYEWYKSALSSESGVVSSKSNFLAGLAAGITEAVFVVTPMEVVKIRLQAQHHSMADPLDVPKYRNAAHALYTVAREEGVGALWRGVSLTALRQGSNQAVNFTVYTELKAFLQKWHTENPQGLGWGVGTHVKADTGKRGTDGNKVGNEAVVELPGYETMTIGLISGAMGPLSNAPIDTIKTRLQKTPAKEGEGALTRILNISK